MISESTTERLYKVKTGNFEGPLELLLDLIEKRKLFVNEVSLSEVTNDYVEYVRSLPKINLVDSTSFVLIAATLILIKSRSLLPNLNLTGEEEEKIVDLEKRLRLYQHVREAGEFILQAFGRERIYFSPEREVIDVVFSPHPSITKKALLESVQNIFNRLPKKEPLPEVSVRKVISLDEMIENLTQRIEDAVNMSFKEFARHPKPEDAKDEKVYVIISFLAILELVREGIVSVLQQETFSDMTISKTENI